MRIAAILTEEPDLSEQEQEAIPEELMMALKRISEKTSENPLELLKAGIT